MPVPSIVPSRWGLSEGLETPKGTISPASTPCCFQPAPWLLVKLRMGLAVGLSGLSCEDIWKLSVCLEEVIPSCAGYQVPRFFEIKALPVISMRNQAATWMGFGLLLMAGSLRHSVFIVPTVYGWVFMSLVKK